MNNVQRYKKPEIDVKWFMQLEHLRMPLPIQQLETSVCRRTSKFLSVQHSGHSNAIVDLPSMADTPPRYTSGSPRAKIPMSIARMSIDLYLAYALLWKIVNLLFVWILYISFHPWFSTAISSIQNGRGRKVLAFSILKDEGLVIVARTLSQIFL